MSKKPKRPRVKKIKLLPNEIVHIQVPPTLVPVVIPDPVARVVTVVPAPKEKQQTWLQYLFGADKR
jgi:hypothetical protein